MHVFGFLNLILGEQGWRSAKWKPSFQNIGSAGSWLELDRREAPELGGPLCSENGERECPFVCIDTAEKVRYTCYCTLDAVQDLRASYRGRFWSKESLETMSRYRKLMTICCVGVLALGLAACGGGGDSGPSTADHDALKERLAAAVADRDAAQATAAAAAAAQAEAEAAQAAAEAAQATAEAAEAAAEAARMAAEAAQVSAESERDAANVAWAAAMAAQAMAESERDAANAASDVAAAAQAAAEEAQATAQTAAEAARLAQGMAQSERAAAEMAQAEAEEARDAANAMAAEAQMNADAANARATASEADAVMKAQEAMDANERAMAAADAQATAEMAQAEAETARDGAAEARDAALALLNTGQQEAAQQVAAALKAQGEAEAARDAAVTARDEALEDKGAAELARDTALMQRDEAIRQRDAALEDDSTDEMTISGLNGQIETLNGQIETLNGQIETLNGTITTLNGTISTHETTIAGLNTQITTLTEERDKYKQMVEDAAENMVAAENLARVSGIGTAISGNRVGTSRGRTNATGTDLLGGGPFAESNPSAATQLPFGTDADDGATPGAHGVSAERNNAGMVTVKLPAALKFSAGAGTAAASDPWTGVTVMSRRMGGKTAAKADDAEQQVVVYTNIGAPTPRALASDFETGETHIDVDTPDERADVMPASVPSIGGPAFQYAPQHEFAGNYRGFSGTFTCTVSCSVTTNSDGEVTVSGEMNFEPADLAAIYHIDDTSYAYFGWWLHKPDNADGTHMVESFAGGNSLVAAVDAVTGTASYEGRAAGKYVTETYTAGRLVGGDPGHFTATASLEANFDNVASGDLPAEMIRGSIDNFVLSSGNDASDWLLTLSDGAIGAEFGGTTSVTFGGPTVAPAGNWRGAFYDTAPATPAGGAPGTVAGTFDAHAPGASITGGFGATK